MYTKRLIGLILVIGHCMLMGAPKFPSFTTPSMPTKGDIQRGLEKGKRILLSKKGKLLCGLLSAMLLDRNITNSRWFEKEKQSLWDDDIAPRRKVTVVHGYKEERIFFSPFEQWLQDHFYGLLNNQKLKKKGILFDREHNIQIEVNNQNPSLAKIIYPKNYEREPVVTLYIQDVGWHSLAEGLLTGYVWRKQYDFKIIASILLGDNYFSKQVLKNVDKQGYIAVLVDPSVVTFYFDKIYKEAYKNHYLLPMSCYRLMFCYDPNEKSDKEPIYSGKNLVGKYIKVIIDDIRKHKKGDQSKTNLVSIYKDTYINRRAFINRVYWRIVKKVIGNKP